MEILELKKELIYRINAADKKTLLAIFQMFDTLENNVIYKVEKVMEETTEKYEVKKNIDFSNPAQEIKDLLEIAQKQVVNGQTKTNEEVKEFVKNKYGFRIG